MGKIRAFIHKRNSHTNLRKPLLRSPEKSCQVKDLVAILVLGSLKEN